MARPERNAFPPANRRDRFIDPSRHPSTRTKTDETKASRRCAYILPTINDRACLPALHGELCSRENSTGSSAVSSYEVRSERETISTRYPEVGFPCYSHNMLMKNSRRECPSSLRLELAHDNVYHQFWRFLYQQILRLQLASNLDIWILDRYRCLTSIVEQSKKLQISFYRIESLRCVSIFVA